MSCPLCKAEKLTEWLYEDDVCWVAYCINHPSKLIVVLKKHSAQPNHEEAEHIAAVMKKLFPNKRWRGPRSVVEHFHFHEV